MKYLIACAFACLSFTAAAAPCKSDDVQCITKKLPGGDCLKGDDACRKKKVIADLQKPADTSFNFDAAGALARIGIKQSEPVASKHKSTRPSK